MIIRSIVRKHRRLSLSQPLVVALAFVLLFGFPACARCDEPALGGVSNQVKLNTVEGRTFSGRLKSLDANTVALEGTPPQTFPVRDLISIAWPGNRPQSRDNEPVLVLANGDLLGLRPEQATEESFVGRWSRYPGWSPLTVPMEWVRGALLIPPREREARSGLLERVASNQMRSDVLYLQSGDTVAGQWQGLKGQKIQWKTTAGAAQFDLAGIQAFSGNPELIVQTPPPPIPPQTRSTILCRLTDGSVFTLKSLRLKEGDKLLGTLVCGPEVEISSSAISGLWFQGGRVTYLSDLKPESYKFIPYLSQEWPLRTDRSVQGGPLRLRGIEYPKGLGMHSRSEVVYRLDGRFRRFQSTIGIDDDASGKGSATFEVLVDGKPSYKSPVLTGTSPAVAIPPVNVEKARTLTLIVDFATQADIQDHADWCQALLLN